MREATEEEEDEDNRVSEVAVDAGPPLQSACDTDAAVALVSLKQTGHRVGVAIAARHLPDARYAEIAARDFNYVIPENEMKWDATERTQGVFTFDAADRIVRFAEDNDMLVNGHTLVWHSQLPSWVEELEGEDAVRAAMTAHIQGVVSYYEEEFPGRVTAWDVVNEAFESNNGVVTYRDSVFHRELGEAFIAEAFHLAHEAAPNALLFYNDFGIEGLGPKSQATFEMIRDLVDQGVPIDGIGFQMHTLALPFPPREDFEENLKRYVELDLKVNISEMDVTLCYGFTSAREALEAQRERYNSMVGTCMQSGACNSVSVWGVTDRHSWLNDTQSCEAEGILPWPLLYDDNYEKKPAWWGLFDALTGCYTWQ